VRMLQSEVKNLKLVKLMLLYAYCSYYNKFKIFICRSLFLLGMRRHRKLDTGKTLSNLNLELKFPIFFFLPLKIIVLVLCVDFYIV
jgi:hypothetical protein